MKAKYTIAALFISALAFAAGGLTQAQSPTPPAHHHVEGQGHHGKRAEEMRTELGLSDDQFQRIEAIHTQYHPQVKALREQAQQESGTKAVDEATRAEIHRLREAEKAEVAKVLTPEQQEKLKALHEAHRQNHCGHMGPHGEAARNYHRENILPVLNAQRLKLEPAISEPDKAAIKSLRERIGALHMQKHDARKDMKAKGQEPDPKAMEAFHEARKAIMDEAEAIALRYQTQIEALKQEIQPQIERWKTDMEALDDHHGKSGPRHEGKTDDGKFCPRQAARFLLLDPYADPKAARAKTADPSATRMQVFPNPASTRTTLRFQLPQAGDVTVELIGQDGRVLKQLSQGNRADGEHFIDVDTQDLPAGTYLFRLSTPDAARVRQFSVLK